MPEVEPPLLEIQLLRGPTVTAAGEPVAIPGRLRRRLLWRLAVAGGALVDTEDLIAVVWPTDPPRTAAGMVGSHVARLRSLLAGHGLPAETLLPRSDGGYRIDGAATRVDVHTLAGRVADCREAGPDDTVALDRAVADLHRFVPATDDAAADSEPWLRDAVDAGWLSVREICRLALHPGTASAAELDARRTAVFGAVSALARRWPYDETVAAWQVELLARSGRPAEALRTVATVRDRLADELGVNPSVELTHAHELALGLSLDPSPPVPSPPLPAGSVPPPADAPPPRPLPQPPAPLIGRDRDLAQLRELTRTPTTVLITGPAGVGKSGLALGLAAELAERYPLGQLYLDLHAPGPGDVDDPDTDVGEAAATALALLGVPAVEHPRRTADRTALLRSVTATTPLLWVLDNVLPQHAVAQLLPTEPGSSVIVTSVVTHPDLLTADRHEVARLTDADADRLLIALVGADRLRGDPGGRGRIVAACEGWPAAIRGVAGRIEELGHLPLTVLADRLADPGDRLEMFSLGSHGVGAALDLSRDGLPVTARRVLPGLGLLADGPIDPDRLAAVVGLPPAAVAAALDELVRAGLVGWETTDPSPGHRVSGLIGRYALRLWQADHTADETEAARARADRRHRPVRPRLVSGDG